MQEGSNQKQIRIHIADDHRMFIDGLISLLRPMKNISVSATAENGQELLQILETTPADLILMDLNMPVLDGIETTRMVRLKYPDVKIIMLTMHNTREFISKVLKAGAHGYILKNTGKEELSAAIQKVMSGESYFSKEVTDRIMDSLQGNKYLSKDQSQVVLTERELEVLRLIVQELTSNEIADKLCISFNTVETHRKNLISKLNVKNVAGLVKYAIQHGISE